MSQDQPTPAKKFTDLLATLPDTGNIGADTVKEVVAAAVATIHFADTQNAALFQSSCQLVVINQKLMAENTRLKEQNEKLARALASKSHSDFSANA